MMLLDDIPVQGQNMVVKGNLELRTEDIAGETSGSDSVEKGIKPKILRVSLQIPFTREKDLGDLVRFAEMTDRATGARRIWPITHATANAAGIRQVQFTEHLNWEEAGTQQFWKVSFTLRECLSNPERAEARGATQDPMEQVATAKPVSAGGTQFDVVLQKAEALQ